MNINDINFSKPLNGNLFSDIAESVAYSIKYTTNREGKTVKNQKNKNAQLRKFYDELVMWNDKVQQDRVDRKVKFEELLPFIKMLKAKVAYASGRGHVDTNFKDIFYRCIDQIESDESLKYSKLFMEAVMGFCKSYE